MVETIAEPLAPAPSALDEQSSAWTVSRSAFRYLNRFIVVPLHRAGLSAWLGSPLSGWQLLLTTVGRTTHRRRDTPLGYYIADGAAWVLAGYGRSTLWYGNLLAEPRVDVLLPGRPPFAAIARDVTDPAIRARIIPPLIRSMRLPGMLIGTDPRTAPDATILRLTAWVPLVRLQPTAGPLGPGPDDPGGLGWVWRQPVMAAATIALLNAARRRFRR